MKIRTFWWGVRLLADTDEDWDTLVKLSQAEVITEYESGSLKLEEPLDLDPDFPEDRRFLDIMR